MKPHWQYLKYVLRHKWYVMRGCFGWGLIGRGILHDWSKFMPCEWFPYVHHFHGPKPVQRDKVGYYKPTDVSEEFDRAWLHHIHNNSHHWQYWLLVQDEGGFKTLAMPLDDILEMVADWRGAGKAQGRPDTGAWYKKHEGKMKLHPETRDCVEWLLGIPQEERWVLDG